LKLIVGDKSFEVIEDPKKAYYIEIDKMKEVSKQIVEDLSGIDKIEVEEKDIQENPQEVLALLFDTNMLDPKMAYEIAPAITRYKDTTYEERKEMIEKQALWGDVQELRNFFLDNIFTKILTDEATGKATLENTKKK